MADYDDTQQEQVKLMGAKERNIKNIKSHIGKK